MSDDGSLFDAAPYTKGEPRKPKRAAMKPPPEVVPIVVDRQCNWSVVVGKQPGVVHYKARSTGTGCQTQCGVIGLPLTYAAGEVVMGCRACIDRGAPAQRHEVAS